MRSLHLPLVVCALLGATVYAQSPATPPAIRVSSSVDSGYLNNSSISARVVFREHLRYDQTSWMQLRFGESVSLPAGSFLRMTATLDGAVQRHTALTLVDWAGVSAGFNGNEVVLELVAGPGTIGNRVVIDEVTRGLPIGGPETICGVDNRVLSSDPRQGRLFIGCSGWMIGQDVMLTAGHCVSSGTKVIEFNVPLSTSGGSIVRSHPDDQYPFTTLNSLNAGVGSDWSVNRVGPNSNHGQLPTQRNGGQWYALGNVPSSPSGNNIRITGYGSTSSPVSPTWYLVQKTHVGPLAQVNATSLCYVTDTTGGNSGSPVIHENTGNAIGIHTHGGCTSSGTGCNSGTRVDRSDLQAAIFAASRTPGQLITFGQGCQGTGRQPPVCVSMNSSGGTLTNSIAANEYAYTASTATAINVTGMSFFTASNTGSPVTVNAAIYGAAGGLPTVSPLARTTLTVGTTPGFYQATFAAPVAIPAGGFYVAVDHSARTTYLCNLTSGTAGSGYWRRTPLTGTWSRSGIITTPSFQVLCQGGGTVGAVPAISGAGDPIIARTYSANLSLARANSPASVLSGFSNTTWAGGTLPFSLAGIGATGCDLLAEPALSAGMVTDGNGLATFSVRVPNNPALIGFQIFHQWLVIDSGANQLGLAVSNGLEVHVGG